MIQSSLWLRRALQADAIFSGVSAVVLTLGAAPLAPWLNRRPLVAQLHAGPARLGVPERLARRAGCWASGGARGARELVDRSANSPVAGGRPPADRRLG